MRTKKLLFALYLFCCWKASAVYLDKRTLTIDHTKVGTINNTDQTNFTVLFCANSVGNCSATISDFKTAANGGLIQNTTTCCRIGLTVPADLIFTSDALCTTKVAGWDIEAYSATTGAIIVWVLIGTVSHTSDTVFYACYNNTLVTTYQSTFTSAYDSSTKAVFHCNDASTTGVNDSTINANSSPSNSRTDAAGQIGRALNFSPGVAAVAGSLTGFSFGSVQRTTSSWFNFNGTSATPYEWMSYGTNSTGTRWSMLWDNDARLWAEYSTWNSTIVFTADSNWHNLVIVLPNGSTNPSQVLMYLDGVSKTVSFSGAGPLNTSGVQFTVTGAAELGGFNYLGLLDESRISSVARTADWINTEYKNQSNPGTFLSISGLISGSIHHKSTLQ